MLTLFASFFALLPAIGSRTADLELDAHNWSSVREAHAEWRHAARPAGEGFEVVNPGQAWLTHFDGRGFLTEPESGAWSWGLELVSFGFPNQMQQVEAPTCVEAESGEVRYRWSESLVEWYVNDHRGLEHGYTLRERPGSAGSEEFLQLDLRVRGGLTPLVQPNELGVSFLDAAGRAVLTYSGLTVFDATGRELPAWFETCEVGTADFRLFVDDAHAQYPVTVDPLAQQEAYLKASNSETDDEFGNSVSIYGNRLVVGAPKEDSTAVGVGGSESDNGANASGAAYVFVRDEVTGAWSQEAYLKASHSDNTDWFGWSVSIHGDRIAVSAPEEDSSATGVNGSRSDTNAPASGAVFVFVRDAISGTWSQEAYVKASNTDEIDWFGASVSLSDDRLVVGARFEDGGATGINGLESDNSAPQAGAAYVFVRDQVSGAWSQEAYLKASNTGTDDRFGFAVSISGDRLVVGAPEEDSSATGVNGSQLNNDMAKSGAAYVFVRNAISGVWSQEAYVKASNTGLVNYFGSSVSLSGDRLLVGAPGESSNALVLGGSQTQLSSQSNSGAAYVFVRDAVSGVWSEEARLKASNSDAFDRFGYSVSISGNRLLVGAKDEAGGATGINGLQFDNSEFRSGAAYVFVRDDMSAAWNQWAYVKASNPEAIDHFGNGVSIFGDRLVVGAYQESSAATGINGLESDNSAEDSGAAYTFDISRLTAPIVHSYPDHCNGDGGDQMGCSDCVCANNAQPGSIGGCLNSTGRAARLIASGDPSVSLPAGSTLDLRFRANNGRKFQLFLLNSGDALAPSDPASPCFGLNSGVRAIQFDGLRCAITNTLRNGGRVTDVNGEVGFDNQPWGGEGNPPGGIAQFFGYSSGTTKYFQCIYRDIASSGCGTALNTTQAVEVTFIP